MQITHKLLLVVALSFLGLSLVAVGAPVAIAQQSATDAELSAKHVDFERFAHSKVKQLNRNHNFSKSRMEITKMADGTYRARYHKIDDASLKVKVRRSQSSSIPYVGVLAYQEQILESSARSPEQFDDNLFAVVKIIPNRHIFSYKKGAWN